ncbi:MAG: hypothetical protein HYS33_04120 [Acidobacteria bacterium]|nr:hypothetical protein [Acidobacteriota bacterium]MBI1983886.1 hypothetical protein [Acidobacteriota bacterium]
MMESNPEGGPNGAVETDADRVVADVQSRTLNQLEGKFSRLIYLASLRDHNTGRYHHYGLEARYPSEAVDAGLRICHAAVFEDLVELTLEEQTRDLLTFFESLKEEKGRLVEVWGRLRSYRILPPENCHPLARELFDANMVIILRILRETELWELLRDSHGDSDHLS